MIHKFWSHKIFNRYILLLIVAVVVVAGLLGLIVSIVDRTLILFSILALTILITTGLIVKNPHTSVYLMALVAANPLEISDRLSFSIPGIGNELEFREILLILILGLAMIKSLYNQRLPNSFQATRLLVPSVLFSAFVLIQVPISIFRGIAVGKILAEAFPWIFYPLLPTAIAILIKSEKELKRLIGLALFGAIIVALLSIAQLYVGPDIALLGVRQLKLFHGNVRVYTESEALKIIAASMFFAKLLVTRHPIYRLLALSAVLLLLLSTVVAFSRTLIVVLGFALFLVFLFVSRRIRMRSLIALFALASLAVFLVSNLGYTDNVSIIDTMTEWFIKIVAVEGQESLSVTGRTLQIRAAVEGVRNNPILGIGLGNSFIDASVFNLDLQSVTEDTSEVMASTVHNGYFQIAVKLGIFGLALFMYWIGVGLNSVYRFWKIASIGWREIAIGIFVGLVAAWLINNLVTWVISPSTLAQLGLFLGISETYLILNGSAKRLKSPQACSEHIAYL